jgi:hypothetical protein
MRSSTKYPVQTSPAGLSSLPKQLVNSPSYCQQFAAKYLLKSNQKEVEMNRLHKNFFLIAIVISLNISLVAGTVSASSTSKERETAKGAAFQDAMRKLWEDHIMWTRVFIISAAADLPDKAAATDRLLQNQVDVGNAIKPYYGDAAGDQLTEEVVARLQGNWAADIAAYDKVHEQILHMADMLSAGIVSQHTAKFK